MHIGMESPSSNKINVFALGFSLLLALHFRVTETETLFGLAFLSMVSSSLKYQMLIYFQLKDQMLIDF